VAFCGIRIAAIVLLPLFPICGGAADSALNRPILGYAAQFSPPELRAILGAPGAAVFSDPLSLPRRTRRLRLSPSQQYALIERDDQSPAILGLSGVTVGPAIAITGALPAADIAAFSPSGHSAVLFSSESGRLQVVGGLPLTPQIVQDLDAGLLPGVPEALAVSDDAGAVLLSSAGVVYLLSPDGSSGIMVNVAGMASLAFFPNSANAAVGDRGAGSVYVLQNSAGVVAARLIADALTGLGEMRASDNGQTLYVTNPGGQCIWAVGVPGGEIQAFSLPVKSVKIDPLRNTGTFLISSEPGRPGWIFFRQGDDARTVFVPAVTRDLRRSPERVVSLK
jgi:hypothetical protein